MASAYRSAPNSRLGATGLARRWTSIPPPMSSPLSLPMSQQSAPRKSLPSRRLFMSTISKTALTDYAQSLRGPAKDRAFTVGASDIGQCSRKTFFAKHNGKRNPRYVDAWGATLRGHIIEQTFWAPALRARFGADLKFLGDRQR